MKRREFLGRTAAASLFVSTLSARQTASRELDRIGCNSWPFRAYFDTPEMHRYRDAKLPLVTQPEFPEFLADHFQIHNVEFLPQHFTDTDASTIAKIKEGLKKAGSRCCNLMGVEFPGGVYAPHADRHAISSEGERWIGVALALGSPSITIALTGKDPADPHVAAKNLASVVDTAHRRGLKVLFHNDDMKRESAEILRSVIKELGPERTGTCPDFGNFAIKSAAFALSQLRMLAPLASTICHAKDGIAENGKMYDDDFAGSMKVMRDAGFRGIYSMEYEGLEPALDGTRKLIQMTEQSMA